MSPPVSSASVSSENSPYEVIIELGEVIYNPGDVVSGQVTLDLKKKLCCDVLNVRLYGSARVFFTEKITKPGALSLSKAYEQEQILVDEKKEIWACPKAAQAPKEISLDEIARMSRSTAIRIPQRNGETQPGLDAGKHTFPFTFVLPKGGLHTSFDAKNSAGYVRYYVLLQALSGGHTVLRRKLLFPVVVPKHLSKDESVRESPKAESTKSVGKGTVTVTLNLNKRGYVPGEPITGDVTIDNKSDKSVKYASFRLMQVTTCLSIRPEVQVHESSFETPGMAMPVDKVVGGQRYTYPIRFYVPALVPQICVPECIHTKLFARLEVGLVRSSPKSAFLNLMTPIVIGTHPGSMDDALLDHNGDSSQLRQRLPTAPPSYDETLSTAESASVLDLPPSYASSVCGLSEITENGASPTNENYTPMCYHYNFGFSGEETGKKKNE
ncbi:arrestin domain-containing protein 2-like isoform X3 [Aphelenchoides avenae]|nr:arrestin domain-containing protein 2-like isoform X3 [Aphelenchus avenae]